MKTTTKLSSIVIIIIAVYWIIDTAVGFIVFGWAETFLQSLLPFEQPHVLYMRLVLVLCLILFALIAQKQISYRNTLVTQLADNEERLNQTLKSIGDGVIVVGTNSRVEMLNPVAEYLIGITSQDAFGMPITSVFKIFNPKTKEAVKLELEAIFKDKVSKSLPENILLQALDNREFYISDSYSPILNNNGDVIGAIIVFRDVTEKLKASEALIESEYRFRSVIANSEDGIFMLNETGVVIEWNQSMERLSGINKDKTIGQYFWNVFEQMPSSSMIFNELLRLIKESYIDLLSVGQPVWLNKKFEIPFEAQGKENKYYEFYSYLIPGEIGYRLAGTFHDITERINIQRSIQQGLDKFFKVFHLSPNGISITRFSDGSIIEVNSKFTEITKFERNEIIGKSTNDLHIWVDDTLSREDFLNELTTNSSIVDRETYLRTKEGKMIPASSSFSIIELYGEKCILSFIKDISVEKNAKEALLRYQQELEQRVRERTQMLEQTNLELEQINHELSNQIRERQRAETALVNSEEKLRSLVNQLPVGVYRTNMEGQILQGNPALMKISGINDLSSMSKTNVNSFYEKAEIRNNLLDQLKSSSSIIQVEMEIRKLTGEKIWVRDTGNIILDENGKPAFIDGILEDITEEKHAQTALIESEERYRMLFEKLFDIYFKISHTGVVQILSPSAKEILGFNIEELINKDLMIFIKDKDEINNFLAEIQKYGNLNNYIFRAVRKDGSLIFLSVDAHLVYDEKNNFIGVEGIARDITQDKKYQNYLSTISEISKAINSTVDLNELFQEIHKNLNKTVECKNLFIALYDKTTQRITFPYYVDEIEELTVDYIELDENKYLSARVIAQGITLMLVDEEMLPYCSEEEIASGRNPKVWLGMPLVVDEEVIGALVLQDYNNPNQFTYEDIEFIESITGQIAVAIARKKALIELNFQNDFMQKLIDTIPNPIYYKDAVRRQYLGCNKAFETKLGLNRQEVIGKTVFELYQPYKAEYYDQMDTELINNKGIQQYEDLLEIEDGKALNMLLFRSCYFGSDNEVAGIVGIIVDITNIKKAEEEVRLAKEYAELLNKVTPSCIFTVDRNRRITSWNERISALTGYKPDEIIGKPCYQCLSILETETCPIFDDSITKPIFGRESVMFTKAGDKKIITMNIDLLRNAQGEVIGGIESFEDITERKQIEEALFWEAAINSAFADLSRAIITLASLKEITDTILEHACNLTGSLEGFVGYIDLENGNLVLPTYNTIDGSATDTPYVFKKYPSFVERIMENKQSLVVNDYEENDSQDDLIDFHINLKKYIAVPALFGAQLVGIIAVTNPARDYSDKDTEILERLASLFAVALQRIRSEEEIRQALEKEQELNELKSSFIAMVSHEYRTPLQAILMSTQLLSDYGTKLSDENKQKYFGIINKSIQTMETLLKDIITFNKTEVGKIEVNPVSIDIEQFCLDFTYEMQYFAKGKCRIDFSIDKEDYQNIIIDEKLIRQSLVSVFTNAIKYSYDDSSIEFDVKLKNGNLILSVKDYGIGITETDKQSLFEPFFRGKNIGNVSGTGLGLSIAKNSITALGGYIECISNIGEGTTFIITVPFTT